MPAVTARPKLAVTEFRRSTPSSTGLPHGELPTVSGTHLRWPICRGHSGRPRKLLSILWPAYTLVSGLGHNGLGSAGLLAQLGSGVLLLSRLEHTSLSRHALLRAGLGISGRLPRIEGAGRRPVPVIISLALLDGSTCHYCRSG